MSSDILWRLSSLKKMHFLLPWQCPENTEAQVHSEHAGLLLGRPVYLHSDGALQLGRPFHLYQEAESIAGTFGADFLPAALLGPALHAQAEYQAGFGGTSKLAAV
jgi:hypothetical protein